MSFDYLKESFLDRWGNPGERNRPKLKSPSDRETSSAAGNDGHASSSESQIPGPDLASIFIKQIADLHRTWTLLKETTNQILGDSEGQPTAIALKNPKTGESARVDRTRFLRLNEWLSSNMDILGQFIWKDDDSELRKGELEENGILGDHNRDLALLCDTAYSEVIKRSESLLEETAPLGNSPPHSELIAIDQSHLESIKEEQNRFSIWISNTGIVAGAASILVNHDLYKHVGELLQSILIDLISFYEDCLITEPSVQNGWLDESKCLLRILPDKSDRTEGYLLSDASQRASKLEASSSVENLKDEDLRDPLSGAPTERKNSAGNAPITQQPLVSPERQHGQNNSSQNLDDQHQPQQSPEPGVPRGRSGSEGSIASSSFSIIIDKRSRPEIFTDSLKDSNKTLMALVRSLEMAKAHMGVGSHSKIYRTVSHIQHNHHRPQVSAPFRAGRYFYVDTLPLDSNQATKGHHASSCNTCPSSGSSTPIPIERRRPREKVTVGKPQWEKDNTPKSTSGSKVSPQGPPLAPNDEGKKASNEPNYPEIYLWGRIKAAALTDDQDLRFLLMQLKGIGFGLYMDKHYDMFAYQGVERWMIVEIIRCMWNDDSKMIRDEFGKKAKTILSNHKGPAADFILEPTKNVPMAPAQTVGTERGSPVLEARSGRNDLYYTWPPVPRTTTDYSASQDTYSTPNNHSTPTYVSVARSGSHQSRNSTKGQSQTASTFSRDSGFDEPSSHSSHRSRRHSNSRDERYGEPNSHNSRSSIVKYSRDSGYEPSNKSTREGGSREPQNININVNIPPYKEEHNKDADPRDPKKDEPSATSALNKEISRRKSTRFIVDPVLKGVDEETESEIRGAEQ